MAFLLSHRTAVFAVLAVLVALLAFWAVYAAGTRRGEADEHVRALDASRAAIAASVADAKRARDSVARENDRLHQTNVALHARNDSLDARVEQSHAAAAVVRSKLVIVHDTATVATDAGPVRVQIPAILAAQIASERASMDSAYRELEAHRDSVVVENRGLLKENAGLRVEIALDSVETKRLRTLNDSSDAEIAVLKREHAPRFTFGEGLIGGAAGTLAILALLAF